MIPSFIVGKLFPSHLVRVNDYLKAILILFLCLLALHQVSFFDIKSQAFFNRHFLLIIYSALLVSSMLYLYKLSTHTNYKNIIFSVLTLSIGLLHFAGTYGWAVMTSALALGVTGIIFLTVFYCKTKEFSQHKLFLITLIACSTIAIGNAIFHEQILNYRRNSDFSKQTTYSKYSHYLKGIKIEKDFANVIDQLYITLNKLEFDKSQDKILPFANIPGIITSLGILSYGETWIHTHVDNFYERMCCYVNFEPIGKLRHVYVLSITKDFDLKKYPCLTDKLRSNGEIKKFKIGKMKHHYIDNPAYYDLYLMGPYVQKKEPGVIK